MTSGENEITFPFFMAFTMRHYQLGKGIRQGKRDEEEHVIVREGSPLIYPSKLEGLELTGPKRSFCKEPERDKGGHYSSNLSNPLTAKPWPSPRVMRLLSICGGEE